jgi:hypothetical protein
MRWVQHQYVDEDMAMHASAFATGKRICESLIIRDCGIPLHNICFTLVRNPEFFISLTKIHPSRWISSKIPHYK